MINEYLFGTDTAKESIDNLKSEGVKISKASVENTTLWLATFSTRTNNEEDAKKLSDVHFDLLRFSPLVLTCESSEYFNKSLYPQINEMERKLRKLLYLAVSISNDESAKSNIKQLEEKDFGQIFNLLFIDIKFI